MSDLREKLIKYYGELFPSKVMEDPKSAERFADNIRENYYPSFLEVLEKELEEMESSGER